MLRPKKDSGSYWWAVLYSVTAAINDIDALSGSYLNIYLIRIVSLTVSFRMNPRDKWSCTNMTAAGLFRVETAIFTLQTLKGVLNDTGSKFGLLIIDACFNYLKTGRDVFGILGNERSSICENGDDSKCLDPKKIVAVIGGDSSGTTKQVYTCM